MYDSMKYFLVFSGLFAFLGLVALFHANALKSPQRIALVAFVWSAASLVLGVFLWLPAVVVMLLIALISGTLFFAMPSTDLAPAQQIAPVGTDNRLKPVARKIGTDTRRNTKAS